MKLTLTLLFGLLCSIYSYAGTVTGFITNDKGEPLPFASVSVKGSSKGVVANSAGKYNLQLQAGTYTLICEHVGHTKTEKRVEVGEGTTTANFSLTEQEYTLREVVVKKGEDPAMEIMRQAIKKRPVYQNELDSFSVEVYIKGLMRSRNIPDKFMGKKIDKSDMKSEGLDSAGRGILFLSESVTKVHVAGDDKMKMEVISSRESGGGYGLSFPFFIDFYQPNVKMSGNALNKRGFVSPLSDGAFHYYKFKFEGDFRDNGKLVNKIRVEPKRKNEPLFTGHIYIIEDDWRIHSLDLRVTKEYSLELLDTVRITQLHSPIGSSLWRTRNQVSQISLKMFGFDIAGNFLNVYSNYVTEPAFGPKFFDRTLMKYDTAFNKKDSSYWATSRPVPLEAEEKQNFVFKDSIRKDWVDSLSSKRFRDSLNSKRNPVQLKDFVLSGVNKYSWKRPMMGTRFELRPLIKSIQFNTVEGVNLTLNPRITFSNYKKSTNIIFESFLRYGFENRHFNPSGFISFTPISRGYKHYKLSVGGGKRISQINGDEPIDALTNSIYTLLEKRNYMKIYENWFAQVAYSNSYSSGVRIGGSLTWEDRIPLENSISWAIFKNSRTYLPNNPQEIQPFVRHQAMILSLSFSFQPGQYYIEYPRNRVSLGSTKPIFEIGYNKGIKGIAGSETDFDKWSFNVSQKVNMNLLGEFRYRLGVGGFLNRAYVGAPDYRHFNGNQTIFTTKYLNGFQLAPYYRYSNTEPFYAIGHVEHHFQGLLTNKIPLFNRLKWYLVGGANTFFVNKDNYYLEVFGGIENILKIFRVDFVAGYQTGLDKNFGIRIGIGGLLGDNIRTTSD